MVGISAVVVDGWLDTSLGTTYAALHVADPGGSGAASASAGDATRKAVTFGAAADGVKAATGSVGPWTNASGTETISHLSLWTAVSAGSFIASGVLSSPVTWGLNHRITLSSVTVTVAVIAADPPSGFNNPVTHGDQLVINDVGPWALQEVTKGTETYQSVSMPGRGYFRFDTPDEFAPTAAWPSNANDSNPSVLNDPALHGGVVTGSPVTIDGYSIPVGTRIVQFRDFPDNCDFYAQGTTLKVLFRGCRFRQTSGSGGAGLFNDNGAGAAQQIMMHYCDIGLTGRDLAAGASGLLHVKFLGGSNHRVLRNHHTLSSTFYQPNVVGCSFIENWIDDFVFYYGESGPSGTFGSDVWHMNGISSEGGQSVLTIKRNHIIAPSPDGATGANGFTAAGQSGYGTQPGQTGYGSGTNPGRLIAQTDCIAIFAATGSNVGSSPGSIIVENNYLGGSGVCLYAGNANGGAQNIHVIGNKITTKYWTNGGNFGAITDVPVWGSNGNFQSNNTWADDYGTGGNGSTALADRQYPSGNGPRAGTSFIG